MMRFHASQARFTESPSRMAPPDTKLDAQAFPPFGELLEACQEHKKIQRKPEDMSGSFMTFPQVGVT